MRSAEPELAGGVGRLFLVLIKHPALCNKPPQVLLVQGLYNLPELHRPNCFKAYTYKVYILLGLYQQVVKQVAYNINIKPDARPSQGLLYKA